MRILAFCTLLLAMFFLTGCTIHEATPGTEEQVLYYDRNDDGKVDLERHHDPRISDSDWELRDDNFDGRYEKRISHGVDTFESAVDLPVPTSVRIESTPRGPLA